MHLVHHQLRVSARIRDPFINETDAVSWIESLIETINMEKLYGPVAIYYDEMVGNVGMTAFAIIKTSHIVLHTWDEESPGRLELDIYSCAPFDFAEVLDLVAVSFGAVDLRWTFDNREEQRTEWNTWQGGRA